MIQWIVFADQAQRPKFRFSELHKSWSAEHMSVVLALLGNMGRDRRIPRSSQARGLLYLKQGGPLTGTLTTVLW